ncbi:MULTISPECIES: Met repressor [Methanobrevibacter]|uniref:ribbon-helix-helix domain-containing protein n=1 Tax=Methanobrevibacter TaxID=2172 RepID=UPI0015BA54A5|nr:MULTISPECIES: Met repressor [Methanobrevibacter]MCI7429041.1 Met repressor [Methanobrevibacter sp.]MDD6777005.1 Met repressor [Methanobacteriaceae archaeon]MDY3097059.1 Met repressor [Methanobrevibacter sp.]
MSDVSRTTINLPVDLKKELKKVAIDEDVTLSGLILKMINEGMESRKNNDNVSDEDTF